MKRIQRKRTKGWRMPHNTIYIGRPTKWGNPYDVKDYGLWAALFFYEKTLIKHLAFNPAFLSGLEGKDIACWCKLNKPCHGDIILKYLEGSETTEMYANSNEYFKKVDLL